jgi:hypothetical protein
MRDDPGLQAELTSVLAAYAGAFEGTLRWSAPDTITPVALEATTLRGTVQLADTYFVGASVECGHLIRVEASVALEADDGSVQATSEGALTLNRTDGTSNLAAASDLSTVRGNLDLRLDHRQPHVGRLSTNISSNPDGVSGAVTIEVSYFADRESAEAYARGNSQVENTSEFQVIGTFSAE